MMFCWTSLTDDVLNHYHTTVLCSDLIHEKDVSAHLRAPELCALFCAWLIIVRLLAGKEHKEK